MRKVVGPHRIIINYNCNEKKIDKITSQEVCRMV